jgi:hypothetical protein
LLRLYTGAKIRRTGRARPGGREYNVATFCVNPIAARAATNVEFRLGRDTISDLRTCEWKKCPALKKTSDLKRAPNDPRYWHAAGTTSEQPSRSASARAQRIGNMGIRKSDTAVALIDPQGDRLV